MNVSLLQLHGKPGDPAHNARRIQEWVRESALQGAGLCVTPEHALCGWPVYSMGEGTAFATLCHNALDSLAHDLADCPAVLLGSWGINADGVVGSCAYFVHKGRATLLDTRSGFAILHIHGETIGIVLGNVLHRANMLDTMRHCACSCLIHLDAEPYTPTARATLFERYAMLARTMCVAVLRANAVGGNESFVWSGDSLAMCPTGKIVRRALPWTEAIVTVDSALRIVATENTGATTPDVALDVDAHADTCHALMTGIRDYVRSNGFSQVVLGLSGGMDSALVAALAVGALGASSVLGVLMPSPWTSEASTNDALELAANLGMATHSIAIADLMGQFETALAPRFAGRKNDVTEENVQARIRGTLLMAIANKERRLLLATGNKSELGVGYCTLYGDTAGGLAPLGDVYKTRVYALAKTMNRLAGQNLIPASIFDKAPTAELRPDQKDQDSLPPYEVLDTVLQALVEEQKFPETLRLPGICAQDVERVTQLLRTSEFKRRQVPPALFVSERPFALARWPL